MTFFSSLFFFYFILCVIQMEILEMLAMSGADLNAKNKNDETPSGKAHCFFFLQLLFLLLLVV